jgi:nitrite reductase/ring-hydroxylating ferredoxin subunit
MNYRVAHIDEIPVGKPLIVEINGISLGLIKANDQVYAVRNTCPHKQAPLCKGSVSGTMLPSEPCEYRYGLEGLVLKCPWHGWEFHVQTGEALFGISPRKAQTYPVRIDNGNVYVTLG